jgi:hypothetical protein
MNSFERENHGVVGRGTAARSGLAVDQGAEVGSEYAGASRALGSENKDLGQLQTHHLHRFLVFVYPLGWHAGVSIFVQYLACGSAYCVPPLFEGL